MRGTWGSLNFMVGGIGVFPKAAHLARVLDADGVDHVHCHFATHPALAGFVVHRLTGIPFSFTAHGSDLHVDRHMLPQKVEEAAFVATISDYNRQVIIDTCGAAAAGKVAVVRCGVDRSLFDGEREPHRPGAPQQLCCIGTLHEVKGQRHLIEACRVLISRGVDVRCVLIGDGPDRPALEEQARAAGLADVVTVTGQQTRQEVAALMAGSDVLVAPSVPTRQGKREGIPVVLIEAMASGVPVVASRLSGIPELVEHEVTGLLVDPGDATGIASAVERLAHDPDLTARLVAAGRKRVDDEFDLDRSASVLLARFGETP